VNEIGLTALDLGLRGAASGLFLMMVLVLLRLRPTNRHIILAVALAAGTVTYAIATAPFVPKSCCGGRCPSCLRYQSSSGSWRERRSYPSGKGRLAGRVSV